MTKIVITGGLGYIGTELSKLYRENSNEEVIVIDNNFFSKRVENLQKAGIKYYNIDILDKEKLGDLIYDADIIYHLAGITDVPRTESTSSEEQNKLIYKVGIEGTKNILELANKNAKIIFPSTHVVFEGLSDIKEDLNEEDTVSSKLMYSNVKVENELDIKKSKLNYVILRLGSVHGLSNDATRLNIMPNLFSKLASQNLGITLHGKGVQLKSLVSVFDVARCMKFCAENKNINKQLFHCTSENYSVKEVADICKSKSQELEIKVSDEEIPNLGYTLSNKKLLNTGFEFNILLDKSIEQMINAWRN